MGQQKVFTLCMSLRVTFSNLITLTVISEYGKDSAVDIESVFLPVFHVACRELLSN